MMNIDESNLIIKDTVYNCMVNSTNFIKLFDEFGFFKYALFTEDNNQICLGFQSPDFVKIYEYSGKETLAKEFEGFEYELNVHAINAKFDIVMKINMSKYTKVFEKIPKDLATEEKEKLIMENQILKKELNEHAVKTSDLFSRFRIIFYASVFNKMLQDVKDNKTCSPFVIKLSHDNLLYLVPSNDKVTIIYGINFSQKTDVALAQAFLQEIEDSKRHVKNSVETKYYPDWSKPPLELKGLENNAKQFACGFISFNLFSKYLTTITPKLGYFINLRNYIQYHIHSMKTYLHIRMNKKAKELERKLSEAKIIPDDYLKSMEIQSFYSNLQKKEDDIKLFVQDFKKVNV